ncbi:hypothetical protein X474_27815 [Dethiosulfatarculus sandiegensis]|uniref:Uncharacterized protein n=1 Tax=Dethiosulfatarculus sandiegensis TaxID=1429043 RepID=A0A0D2G735_9BACT|nr:hypothetical protein X474_27815 [Dethiosulfatarculus sandiegensis]
MVSAPFPRPPMTMRSAGGAFYCYRKGSQDPETPWLRPKYSGSFARPLKIAFTHLNLYQPESGKVQPNPASKSYQVFLRVIQSNGASPGSDFSF